MNENYACSINYIDNIAVICVCGPVSLDDLFMAQDSLLLDPAWRPDTDLLLVLQKGTRLDGFALGDLARHAGGFQAWNRNHRKTKNPRTAVVCDNSVFNLVTQIWSAIRRPDWIVEVGIFRTETQAMNWFRESRAIALERAYRQL